MQPEVALYGSSFLSSKGLAWLSRSFVRAFVRPNVQLSSGLEKETVTYRNALGFFPDFGIETVRAPPQRATETTVT